ncbi:MAG: hypothetical protein Fur0037_19370 [Planctomycetota bacterium]
MSLASRFLVTLLLTAVLPFVVFGYFAIRGMRQLVDSQVVSVFLPQVAADHARRIENRLDQIAQACAVVREMARHAVQDPDRVRSFEEQVELVTGLLDNYLDLLLLADENGNVVSHQFGRLLDPTTAEQREALIPASVADTQWFVRAREHGGSSFWLPWGMSPYMHRGLDHRSFDPADYHLGYVLDVPRPSGPPAVLLALIRWPEVQRILDGARDLLARSAGFPSSEVFLVDEDGRVLAHTDRLRYGEPLAPEALLRGVQGSSGDRTSFVDGLGRPCLAGSSAVGGDPSRGWRLGLAIPEEELFGTVARFERVLGLGVLVTMIVLVAWSLVASRAIVKPVRRLSEATARIARGDLEVHVPAAGGPELAELGRAFNGMAQELAIGRERLKHAERQAAWAEMARQVAHEIKNPLTPMRMSAQVLARARADGDGRALEIADRLARTVLEQTAALDRIASDFRQLAGSPRRQTEVVEIDAFLAEVVAHGQSLFAEGGLDLEFAPSAPGCRVEIDRRDLARVFVNLFQNAHQAAAGGIRVRVASSRSREHVVVVVEDDGPGIADEARNRLFEPYFTTKSSGTGLGLAICRRIVENHGGTISLTESRPGRTAFSIELPVIC